MSGRRLAVECSCLALVLLSLPAFAAPEESRPATLPRPFTAEQIRDEWVQGLTLVFRRVAPEGEARERWTVVTSDPEGVVIEFTPVDAGGQAIGASRRQRSTWNELRDHASFPAGTATRAEATRETPLGKLEGWLYTVPDSARGTVSELFFARELPGAPVTMKVTRAGQTVLEMTQVSRSKR